MGETKREMWNRIHRQCIDEYERRFGPSPTQWKEVAKEYMGKMTEDELLSAVYYYAAHVLGLDHGRFPYITRENLVEVLDQGWDEMMPEQRASEIEAYEADAPYWYVPDEIKAQIDQEKKLKTVDVVHRSAVLENSQISKPRTRKENNDGK